MSSRKNRQLYKKGDINLGSSMGDIDTVIIRRKKKKKWGTGFVTLSGSGREEITKKGGEGRNSRESDNCMYFFKTSFIWGKSGK